MAPYTGFSKGRCASPGAMILDDLEELEAAAAEAILPIPGPVALPQPVESTTVGFDMAALLQAVGGADLETVTTLSLRLLVQDSSLQRLGLCLPNLTNLTLDGSYLVSLRDLGTGMSRLRVLRVTRCSLYSLDGLSCLTNLRELYAAHNVLSDIWACTALPHLRVLDLSYTQVRAAGHAGFLTPCTRLRSLSLLGSPAAISGQAYRTEVQRQLPSLQLLDGRALHPATSIDQGSESGDDDSGEDATAAAISPELPEDAASNEDLMVPRLRPSSALAVSVSNTHELGARRVMSARPRANTGSFHAEVAGDEEAPSNLTSGGVVCGSLAAALRHRPVACWGVSRAENQSTSTQPIAATSTDQPPNDQLLDTAKQWRENYSRYRDQNGSRWEVEETEPASVPAPDDKNDNIDDDERVEDAAQ